jgi:hypothetical protein
MVSLVAVAESEDIDATFVSLPELQAANTARLKKEKIFFITVSFGLNCLLSYEKNQTKACLF